jgi:hypothetical protein
VLFIAPSEDETPVESLSTRPVAPSASSLADQKDFVPHPSLMLDCDSIAESHVDGRTDLEKPMTRKRKKETEPREKKQCMTGGKDACGNDMICGDTTHSTKHYPDKTNPDMWKTAKRILKKLSGH